MNFDQLEFSTFCIYNIAVALNMNQSDVYRILKKSGILKDYVIDAYKVTHTFDSQYIVDDITGLMKERGVL